MIRMESTKMIQIRVDGDDTSGTGRRVASGKDVSRAKIPDWWISGLSTPNPHTHQNCSHF